MTLPIISAENISKNFGKNSVFNNCTLAIEKGTIAGLVGLNGSGKTTFIRLLLGLLKPTTGSISVLGNTPWSHAPALYEKMGVVLEHDGFFANMTIAENIAFYAKAKHCSPEQVASYIREYWKNTIIHDEYFAPKKKVKILSRGQKMQCALCRAFLGDPQVCVFDEPTVALDVDACDHFYQIVKSFKARGSTVLISSHQLAAIQDLCTEVFLLQDKTIEAIASKQFGQHWLIKTDNNSNYGNIISAFVQGNCAFEEGAWRFSVKEPDAQIPELVSLLVNQGCKIQEDRPDLDVLKGRVSGYDGVRNLQ